MRTPARFLAIAALGFSAAACTSAHPDVLSLELASRQSTDLRMSVTISGLKGRSLKLRNGSEELPISGNGTYFFPTAVSGAYNVTVTNHPRCVRQTCTVENGSGNAGTGADGVTVTCTDDAATLITSSWGDDNLRITPVDTGATTVVPASTVGVSTGGLTGNQGIVADSTRNILYVADSSTPRILSIPDAKSLGSSPSKANFAPPSLLYVGGLALDEQRDILYVFGQNASSSGFVWIYKNASSITSTGILSPDVSLKISTGALLGSVDPDRDILYVSDGSSGASKIQVFENASSLTLSSTPSRTITMGGTGVMGSLIVDSCTDSLYLTRRVDSATGGVYKFANASSLNGSYDPDTSATASVNLYNAMNVNVDQSDRLYFWADSPTQVGLISGISGKAGDLTGDSSRTSIGGVVSYGYGMTFLY